MWRDKSELFSVLLVLRQWYIMVPSQFNICRGVAVKELNGRVRRGAALKTNGIKFYWELVGTSSL